SGPGHAQELGNQGVRSGIKIGCGLDPGLEKGLRAQGIVKEEIERRERRPRQRRDAQDELARPCFCKHHGLPWGGCRSAKTFCASLPENPGTRPMAPASACRSDATLPKCASSACLRLAPMEGSVSRD